MSTTMKSITELIEVGAMLRLVYSDVDGEITERVVRIERTMPNTKYGLAFFAHCYRRDAIRLFRADRVLAAMPDTSIALTTFASDRPPGIAA